MTKTDVTALVSIADNPDDTLLPLRRCVCGATFDRWQVSISSEDESLMDCCGRRLTWTQQIRIFEVEGGDE